jgi:hypothetical protein
MSFQTNTIEVPSKGQCLPLVVYSLCIEEIFTKLTF